jgi:hypothetical protein
MAEMAAKAAMSDRGFVSILPNGAASCQFQLVVDSCSFPVLRKLALALAVEIIGRTGKIVGIGSRSFPVSSR